MLSTKPLLAVCITCLFFSCASPATEIEQPMNVLFIAVDDMNVDLGSYGHPLVKSPNIDRLASMGTRFDRAYSQLPHCGPSRASVMTGLRPQTTRHFVNKIYIRETLPEVVTLPQMYRNAGYFAARVGKIYHYGNPGDIGTDSYDDPDSWDYTFNPRGRDKDEEDQLIDYTPQRGIGSSLNWMMAGGTDEEQTDGIGATEVIRLLEEQKDSPFFIAAGFYRPHCPYIAPKKYFDLYPLESITLPDEPMDDMEDIPRAAQWTYPPNWDVTPEDRRHTIRAYYATISFVDAQIGRILDTLDRLDLWENTLVVFWSDHGYLLSQHGQWKKQSLFEPSARVPMIVVSPDQTRRGTTVESPVELVDLYPTIANITGHTPPENLEGASLLPLVENPAQEWGRPAFTQVWRRTYPGYSVRTARWRYNEWDRGEQGRELYDYENDPFEYNNLADDPDYAEIQQEMKALMDAHWPEGSWTPVQEASNP